MKSNKHRAELAMIISLPETIKGITKPGRLRNLVNKLSAEAQKIYSSKYKQATPEQLRKIGDGFDKFNKTVQWSERPRHVITYISAISTFIKDRDYEKVNNLMIEIVDFYERVGKVPPACYWSAADAEKIWEGSFND